MKYLMILVLSFMTLFAYSQDFPIMLSIKSDTTIPDDFRDGVEEALTKMGYSLVDDKAQKEALKENAKARNSECYDDECLVDTGKMLAARALISVEVDKKGATAFKFKGRFVDFETGTTTKTKVMYYEAGLSDYKALSKFGKEFSGLLLGGKVKIVETKKEDKVAIKKPIRKEVEKPKEVKKENYKPFPKKVTEKAKDVVILPLLAKRYKGNWDITLGIIGGMHNTYTEYYNDNDEYDREFYGTLTGFGFSLGLTYRWNYWLSFFSEFTFLNSSGEVSRETKYNEYEDIIDPMNVATMNFSLGAQFSFGDTQGTGLIYYGKLAVYSGRDSYGHNLDDDVFHLDVGYGDFISTVGAMIELGININLFFNNNIDVYAALYYGPQTGGGLEGQEISDPSNGELTSKYYLFNTGESVSILFGIRYNVFTF